MGVFEQFPYVNMHEMNLQWVLKQIDELLGRMKSIETWKEEYQQTYDDLKKLYDDLMAGNYPPSFVLSLKNWISEYGVDIIAEKIKAVFFQITDDGYFIAYIPESWNEITFGTSGLDVFPPDTDFGHLTLTY